MYDNDNECVVCGQLFTLPHDPACPYSDDDYELPIRITRRGWVVIGIGAALLLAGIWLVATNLWWTETGYCWGDMLECLNNG